VHKYLFNQRFFSTVLLLDAEAEMLRLFCVQQLQEMDEKRINKVQQLIESSTDIERTVMPIMNKCIDGMAVAAQMIDCKQVRTANQLVK